MSLLHHCQPILTANTMQIYVFFFIRFELAHYTRDSSGLLDLIGKLINHYIVRLVSIQSLTDAELVKVVK